MKVLVLAALLLAFQAPFVSSAADYPTKVFKLQRHNQLPAGGMRVVELPLNGTGEYLVHGPYLTRVELGNPPQSLDVLIDTGSSIPWVACRSSHGLSTRHFNTAASSPTSLACSDHSCQYMAGTNFAQCNGSRCIYDLTYGTGDTPTSSSARGSYLSDVVHLDGVSAQIVFGCTESSSGQLANFSFDGVFGFGPYHMSFASQLFSAGIAARVFTLCMHSPTGSGLLAFGEAVDPGLVYTPMLPSQDYYIVNLQSIAVNGQTLPISSSVFRPSTEQFTFFDSGTTLAYLADGAYDPFVNAIRTATPPSASPFIDSKGQLCFVTSTSIDLSFPSVELHFAGGAKMKLQPHNYLYHSQVKESTYCIAWFRNAGRQVTLLGDIVLVDKVLVHDLGNMRLGWADYDCSRPVNITSSPKKKTISSGQGSRIVSTSTAIALVLTFYIIISF
uniref:Uncharacterized protein n=1 Tax=Avena sativa TaxID=4498 RepID=A0ACD5W8Y6_AVESA